ncbi:MAG: hypothetical protein ABIQ44_14845, partial [Chloroflexia bacterium]
MKYPVRSTQYAIILSLLLLLLPTPPPSHAQSSSTPAWAWPDEWQADSAFFNVWSRSDAPVAMHAASRSWLWGPVPFAVANEPYAESPTGLRLVEYLDKGRMEINKPHDDRSSPWFVTSGLLINEMVTGQYQTGNSTFQSRPPADIPVAGDDYSPEAPTFTSFSKHTERANKAYAGLGFPPTTPTMLINKAGDLEPLDGNRLTPYLPLANLDLTQYDETTGHNIPRVFTDWMAQSGSILENGHLIISNLIDPLYLLGHPITEPYWASIRIDQKPATVLIQLFERRALTYNPANPHEWQVEMANVGRAYYNWLYRESLPTPAIATNATSGSITIRGYNWSPSIALQATITSTSTTTAIYGPLDIKANTDGRFTSPISPTETLLRALQSGASLQTVASQGAITVALPFSIGSSLDLIPLSGIVIGIESPENPGSYPRSYILHLRDSENQHIQVYISPNTSIFFSEGDPANRESIDIGSYVSIEGTPVANGIAASTIRLLSVSKFYAWIGYSWTQDHQHLVVSGASWPPSTAIFFTLRDLNYKFPDPNTYTEYVGPPDSFASLRTDSRGNLQGIIPVPTISGLRLLQANAGNRGTVTHLIGSTFDANGPDLPEVSLISRFGMQLAEFGPFCISECG